MNLQAYYITVIEDKPLTINQSFGGLAAQIGWFGLRVGSHQALSLHSSNEPGKLSQWLCHDDGTMNIVSNIIVIIKPILSAEYRLPLLAKTDPPCSVVSLQ